MLWDIQIYISTVLYIKFLRGRYLITVYLFHWKRHFLGNRNGSKIKLKHVFFLFRNTAAKIDTKVQRGLFIFAVSNSCVNPIVYGKPTYFLY